MSVSVQRRPLGEIGNTLNLNPNVVTPLIKAFPRSESLVELKSPLADEKFKQDPLLVVDYVKEIYEHLRAIEGAKRPAADYMERQPEVNEKMRTIVLGWLVEVHAKFRCKPETLYLSVCLIDRYLDRCQIKRDKFQLIGMVAFWIASKYEEIYPPEADKLIYMSNNTYTREQLIRYEREMLLKLEWKITVPTTFPFLKRFLQVSEADEEGTHLAGYITELALLDYSMLSFSPSCLAAGAVYLSNKLRGCPEPWGRTLEHYSVFRTQDIESCAKALLNLCVQSQTERYKSVRKKFQNPKMLEVSRLVTEAACEAVEIP